MSSSAGPALSNGQGPNKLPTAMEKKNLGGVRQATPDSDAVVSSDEDHEPSAVMSMSLHSAKSMPTAHRPVRRPSWLSEVHSQRKYSLGGPSLASTGGSQPPTPSAENGPASSYAHGLLNTGAHGGTTGSGLNNASSTQSWDHISNNSNLNSMATSGRPGTGHSNSSSSFAWTSPVWQQQPQQLQHTPHQISHQKGFSSHANRWSSSSASLDPAHPSSNATIPTQLQHYQLTSPTSSAHEGIRSPSSSIPAEHASLTNAPSSLPFEIPLEPNRKTIRSQSYSSGIKRSALARRSSRPTIYNMDNALDDSNLYEVDENEPADTDAWGHSPLTTTMSNPATTDIGTKHEVINANMPGISPVQTTQSPQTSHVQTSASFSPGPSGMATKFLPPGNRAPLDVSHEEPETLDTYGEEMVAVGTQRAAEHAQSTLANAEQLAVQAAARGMSSFGQGKYSGQRAQSESFNFDPSQPRRFTASNAPLYLHNLGTAPPTSFNAPSPRSKNMFSESSFPANQQIQPRKSRFDFSKLASGGQIPAPPLIENPTNQEGSVDDATSRPVSFDTPSKFISTPPVQGLKSILKQRSGIAKSDTERPPEKHLKFSLPLDIPDHDEGSKGISRGREKRTVPIVRAKTPQATALLSAAKKDKSRSKSSRDRKGVSASKKHANAAKSIPLCSPHKEWLEAGLIWPREKPRVPVLCELSREQNVRRPNALNLDSLQGNLIQGVAGTVASDSNVFSTPFVISSFRPIISNNTTFKSYEKYFINTKVVAQYFNSDLPRDLPRGRDAAILDESSPHHWNALYLVSFKSSRSDIFVVPENSNVDPDIGDMVIVEGDRGQDMGIVKHARLTIEQAKVRKAEYNRRHYKSLVMFSRMFPHVAAAANTDAEFSESTDAIAASNLGIPRGRKEADAIVPKLIKRIASEQEIKLLRDKEGNEAKAKRICQTKVNQHGLHMEILDAEFQLYVFYTNTQSTS
jgi:PSP1 C-terminal conserved region